MPSEMRPVLNPILALKRDPRREGVTGRAATEAHIRIERLDVQREVLATQLDGIRRSADKVHAGRLLVAIRMFDDSLAPTHEPKAIFREGLNSELVAPVHKGYLAQVKADVLNELSALIKNLVITNFKEENYASVFVKSSTGFYKTENNLY